MIARSEIVASASCERRDGRALQRGLGAACGISRNGPVASLTKLRGRQLGCRVNAGRGPRPLVGAHAKARGGAPPGALARGARRNRLTRGGAGAG